MFDRLTEKLTGVIDGLRAQTRLTEKNMDSALREVRLALLSADVHVQVVKSFTQGVRDKLLGQNLLDSLNPDQHFLKTIHEELVHVLGGAQTELNFSGKKPHVIFLVGLQGSGKTTSSIKLALHWRKKGLRPFLIPADVSRPAAVEQLIGLAKKNQLPFYATDIKNDPLKIIRNGIAQASASACDLVLVDTAGRLHVDEILMKDLQTWKKKIGPEKILFVADAMTGQEAVRVATTFHQALTIDGVILTKLDGDARGGAALSIKQVLGCPIYYVGVGEAVSDFELFQPERLVSRLLDRGDLLSMVEKATELLDVQATKDQARRLLNHFTLEDFLAQINQMHKLGSIKNLIGMIPGGKKLSAKMDLGQVEKDIQKKRAIIQSMTRRERLKPDLLNGSRRLRIARGSGTQVSDVNRLLKEFGQMAKLFKNFKKGGLSLLKNMGGLNL